MAFDVSACRGHEDQKNAIVQSTQRKQLMQLGLSIAGDTYLNLYVYKSFRNFSTKLEDFYNI